MTISDVEPDLLRAFVAVVETGSFTAAAEVVGRTQSAVSQKVLRLEDILQMRVFDRTSRSLNLTRDGERVLVAGKRLLAHYENFIQELRAPPKVSVLRLGISENLVQTQLPSVLSRFGSQHPDVQLELTTAASEELLDAYEAGHLDLVIAKTRKGRHHPGRVIWREPLVWLAGPNYRPDDRRPARLVMMRPPCIYRAIMAESLEAVGREWVTACTTSNLLGIQAAVLGGLGVTALGRSFAQNGLRVLPSSERWPALPTAEVSVIGETPELQHIARPLVTLLTESLLESGSLTLEAPLAAAER